MPPEGPYLELPRYNFEIDWHTLWWIQETPFDKYIGEKMSGIGKTVQPERPELGGLAMGRTAIVVPAVQWRSYLQKLKKEDPGVQKLDVEPLLDSNTMKPIYEAVRDAESEELQFEKTELTIGMVKSLLTPKQLTQGKVSNIETPLTPAGLALIGRRWAKHMHLFVEIHEERVMEGLVNDVKDQATATTFEEQLEEIPPERLKRGQCTAPVIAFEAKKRSTLR